MPKPASKPVIAIDVDDVLSASNDAMREFANKAYGLNLKKEDYLVEGGYRRYWEKYVWKVDKEEGARRYQAYLDSGAKSKHKTVEGAVEAINKLKDRYALVVVTARDDSLIEITHTWLEKHFPKTFSRVEFMPVWDKDKQVSKAAICKEIGASYLIDDHYDHCVLASEEGIVSLLFGEYGWNKNIKLKENIVRIKDWKGALEYFNEKS